MSIERLETEVLKVLWMWEFDPPLKKTINGDFIPSDPVSPVPFWLLLASLPDPAVEQFEILKPRLIRWRGYVRETTHRDRGEGTWRVRGRIVEVDTTRDPVIGDSKNGVLLNENNCAVLRVRVDGLVFLSMDLEDPPGCFYHYSIVDEKAAEVYALLNGERAAGPETPPADGDAGAANSLAPQLSDEQTATYELYKRGWTQAAIAETIGAKLGRSVGQGEVSRWLKKAEKEHGSLPRGRARRREIAVDPKTMERHTADLKATEQDTSE